MSHITNQSGWWSVRPLNQSCYLALGSLERIIILSPSGLVQTLTGGGLILTGEVHLDPSVPADFVNLLKSPNTAFLDLDPGLFTSGRVVGGGQCGNAT